jgi:hypothetical protein
MSKILLLVFLLLFISIAYFLEKKPTEGFQSEGLNLQIRFCPFGSTEFQTKEGNTDCCSGDVRESVCGSKPICTLSPTHDGIPTCQAYVKTWFDRKAKEICPSSLPLYFASVMDWPNKKLRGCVTSENRAEDGSRPSDMNQKRCTDFEKEDENFASTESCLTEKDRLLVRCPSYPGLSSNVVSNTTPIRGTNKKVVLFYCQIFNPNGRWDFCVNDETLKKRAKYMGRRWEDLQKEYGINLCSKYQKVEIEKSEADPRFEPEAASQRMSTVQRQGFCRRFCR